MKLEVGMYVRTYDGINKVTKINEHRGTLYYEFEKPFEVEFLGEDIKKSSFNIIDLIEVGDYVNGMIVMNIKNGEIFTNDIEWNEVDDLETDEYGRICGYGFKKIPIEPIKEILTKEQYEANAYIIKE